MTLLLNRDEVVHRASLTLDEGREGRYAERSPATLQAENPEIDCSGHAAVVRREELFARIRMSRSLTGPRLNDAATVVSFPTVLVLDGRAIDLELTEVPGFFPEGHHSVVAHGVFGSIDVRGRFEVGVGQAFGVSPATWTATDVGTGMRITLPAGLEALLPRSVQVPVAESTPKGAIRRAHLRAERARAELLDANGGLVRSVVNRFRGVARAESALVDLNDLLAVGQHQLLEVADRYFTDPEVSPARDVAWSKLVQRAIGNALRTEIARITGISVEFRQLLSWCHSHPEDRDLPTEVVAWRMAFAGGVTRLMSLRGIRDRLGAEQELTTMLSNGEAEFVPHGRDRSATQRRLRDEGVFVISSRSSLAEIERARRFTGTATPLFDRDTDQQDRSAKLAVLDAGYEVADLLDAVRKVIEQSGLTPVEASVWLHRTGVLDPSGHCAELPDIAENLGLAGRDAARAALRRARRKVDAWADDAQRSLHGCP